jgi:NTP pyrophosphatase (non-canonical NTP hydrolase)
MEPSQTTELAGTETVEPLSPSHFVSDFEFSEQVQKLFVKPESTIEKLCHASMGLAGEAGEIIDTVKKSWIYGQTLNKENILEECGDAFFYIVALLYHSGYTIQDMKLYNILKLKKRYPSGYTDKAATERADKT